MAGHNPGLVADVHAGLLRAGAAAVLCQRHFRAAGSVASGQHNAGLGGTLRALPADPRSQSSAAKAQAVLIESFEVVVAVVVVAAAAVVAVAVVAVVVAVQFY